MRLTDQHQESISLVATANHAHSFTDITCQCSSLSMDIHADACLLQKDVDMVLVGRVA